MAVALGTRLGPYELLSRIGAGGMGEVYRARDVRLGREVAVKVLPESFAGDAEALARFEREARAVASLSHPNILALHDYGSDGGVTYAVMELLEGETLRERVAAGGLSIPRALSYGLQIAQGLTAAHERGVIHRDLKPENLFVSLDGHVKILDFGLAKNVGGEDSGVEAAALVTVGTSAGRHPRHGRLHVSRAGAGRARDARLRPLRGRGVLHEMIGGRNPFRRATVAETMVALLREDAPPLSDSGRDVSPELEEVVAHCLEKHASARFQSARDLAFALRVLDRSGGRSEREDSGDAGRPVPASAGRTRGEAAEASVAVLPFRNMSPDPDAEYFSDGVTEEIISVLSHIPALHVAARTSCFAFKGKDTDVRQIGRELGVRTVLEGSVRQAGRRLRIQAQLVDVATGYHLWSERFDRELEDVFAVQDEIARSIAETLAPRLTGAERRRSARAPHARRRGVRPLSQGTPLLEAAAHALGHRAFEAAVARDPAYAAAYTGDRRLLQHLGLLRRHHELGGLRAGARGGGARAGAHARQRATSTLSLGVIEHYYGWDNAPRGTRAQARDRAKPEAWRRLLLARPLLERQRPRGSRTARDRAAAA